MYAQRILTGVLLGCLQNVLHTRCDVTYGTTGMAGETNEVGIIKTFTLPTLAQCAVECSVNNACEFYGYGFHNQNCSLHTRDFNKVSSVNLVPDYDVITYYKSICSQTDQRPGYYVKGIPGCLWSPWVRETFYDAVNVCKANNARLLDVMNHATLEYVSGEFDHDGQKFWLGGHQDDVDVSTWYWLETGDVISANNGGQFWLPNKPMNDTTQKCLGIRHNVNYQKTGLVDRDCSFVHNYFCIYE